MEFDVKAYIITISLLYKFLRKNFTNKIEENNAKQHNSLYTKFAIIENKNSRQ